MTLLLTTASRHALLVSSSWQRLGRLSTQADRYVGKLQVELQVDCKEFRVSH